jgi:hypothetical protein
MDVGDVAGCSKADTRRGHRRTSPTSEFKIVRPKFLQQVSWRNEDLRARNSPAASTRAPPSPLRARSPNGRSMQAVSPTFAQLTTNNSERREVSSN